jgi:hypothetical protein
MTTTSFIRSRYTLAAAALCLAASAPARADISYHFDFDNVVSGSNANLTITAGAPVSGFASGQFIPREDEWGDPIPGSEYWTAYPAGEERINVADAAPFGRGSSNKLNALFDQVLVQLAQPTTLTGFSFTLDNSTYGNLGTQYLLFLDAAGAVIAQQGFEQNQNGVTVGYAGLLSNVSAVLLPAGKMYDDLNLSVAGVSAVPLPLPMVLLPAGAFVMGWVSRRRKQG